MQYAHFLVTNIQRLHAASGPRAWPRAIALAGLLALVLIYAPARADGGWQIVEVDGKVDVRYGADRWVQARSGDTLFSSAEIITGSDGRVVLARGPSTIAIAPGARIELPRQDDAVPPLRKASLPGPDHRRQPAIERVFQSFGTLLYKVKPDSGRQFQVQTPYLVTTIKGTVFTVAVNTTGAAVHVTEGLVEVMPVLGGIGAMVAAGQAAIVPAERGADVEVRGRDADRAPRVYPGGGPTEESRPADADRGGAQEPAAPADGASKSKESVVFVNAKGVDENGVTHLRLETANDGALRGQANLGLSPTSGAGADDRRSAMLGVENLLEPGGDAGAIIAREGDGSAGDGLVATAPSLSGGTDLNLGGVGDGLGGVVDGVGGTVDGVGDLASGGGLDLGGVGDGLGGVVDGVGGVVDGVSGLAGGGGLDLGGVGDGLDGTLDGVGGVVDGVGDLASGGALDLGGVGEGLDGTLDGVGGVVDGVGDIAGGGDSGSGGGITGILKGVTGSLLN